MCTSNTPSHCLEELGCCLSVFSLWHWKTLSFMLLLFPLNPIAALLLVVLPLLFLPWLPCLHPLLLCLPPPPSYPPDDPGSAPSVWCKKEVLGCSQPSKFVCMVMPLILIFVKMPRSGAWNGFRTLSRSSPLVSYDKFSCFIDNCLCSVIIASMWFSLFLASCPFRTG